ncbi:hypothetical protein [Haloarchaeobius baliensis]|uniref:hypothetical protein n=1 Tax=Haloarchaeobius baliensis TaxID=1670458 RepID=UPI003F883161
MATYYVISSPDHDADRPHSSDWPKVLKLSFEAGEIQLSQGKGHGFVGANFALEEFQVAEWTDFIEACGGEWLREELSGHESLAAIEEPDFVRLVNKQTTLVTEDH